MMKKLLKNLTFAAMASLTVASVQAQDPDAWLHVQFENNLNGTTNVGATPGMTLPVAFQVVGSDVSPALYNSSTPKEGSFALDFSSYPVDGDGAFTGNEGIISNSLDAEIKSDADLAILGNAARTFAAWIRFDDLLTTTGGSHAILQMGAATAVAQERVTWTFAAANDRIQIAVGQGNVNGNYDPNGVTTPNLEEVGVWHHVAFTYEGTTLDDVIFYIDGVATTNDGGNSAVPFNTVADKLTIGSRGNNSLKWFDGGGIDDLRVYDSALTPAEIMSIMGGAYLSTTDVAFGENELKAYPNAVEDFLYLKTTSNDSLQISVYDITGKQIIRTGGDSVDMRDLNSGIYIVKVRQDNKVANLKILKK